MCRRCYDQKQVDVFLLFLMNATILHITTVVIVVVVVVVVVVCHQCHNHCITADFSNQLTYLLTYLLHGAESFLRS